VSIVPAILVLHLLSGTGAKFYARRLWGQILKARLCVKTIRILANAEAQCSLYTPLRSCLRMMRTLHKKNLVSGNPSGTGALPPCCRPGVTDGAGTVPHRLPEWSPKGRPPNPRKTVVSMCQVTDRHRYGVNLDKEYVTIRHRNGALSTSSMVTKSSPVRKER
jgi:hypothetical protein